MKNLFQSLVWVLCCGIFLHGSLNDVAAQTITSVEAANDSALADLAVFQSIRTNQFYLSDGDTLWAARPGETYIYKYTIINNGDATATNVLLYDFLPDSTTIKEDDLVGELYSDTLCIYLYDLAPGEVLVDSFKVSVYEEVSDPNTLFINTMYAVAANEDTTALDDNISVSTIYVWQEQGGGTEGELVLSSNILRLDGSSSEFVFSFELMEDRTIDIDLLDISGYKMDTLVSESLPAGVHSYVWDGLLENGQTIGSGVYVLTLRSHDNEVTSWTKFMVQR